MFKTHERQRRERELLEERREKEISSVITDQPLGQFSDVPIWLDVLFNAVEAKFGKHVEICNFMDVNLQLKKFVNSLCFEVVDSGTKKDISVSQPCVLDVTHKEISNNNGDDSDKVDLGVGKDTSVFVGMKYHFLSKNGVQFDTSYKLGTQAISVGITGGFIRVGDDITTKDQSYNTKLKYEYLQKEKVIIPPDKKISAKITTTSKKYSSDYTLSFIALTKAEAIEVHLVHKFQKKFFCFIADGCPLCCGPLVRHLSTIDLLQAMPDFKADEKFCTFTIDGILTWIGEDCKIEKTQMDI